MTDPQPTPISFENNLAVALLKLMHRGRSTPIWIEGEGKQVGSLGLPPVLWQKMRQSPTVVLEADMSRRIDIGVQDYVVDLLKRVQLDIPGDRGFELFTERHLFSLSRIKKRLGLERYQLAETMLQEAVSNHKESGDLEGYRPFIELLLKHYYDPMYDYQFENFDTTVLATGDENTLLGYLAANGVGLTK